MYNKSHRSRKSRSRRSRKSRSRRSRKSSQKIKYLKGKGMLHLLSGSGNCSNKSYKDCLSCSKKKNRSCIFDYKKQSCRPNKR